jgi:iron complex transport system ATP-binding protein
MNELILNTKNLTIGYTASRQSKRTVASGISVSLRAGELVCLIGPNGAGKSTLMRTLAAMQPALAGTVSLMGEDVFRMDPQELACRLSIVLTERVSVGNLSAYALVALGRYPHTDWRGNLSAQDEAVIRCAMESVGAADLAHRNVDELSDGERQKVMIARALAQEPNIMLLDEPTAFLDLPHRVEIMHILRQVSHAMGRAILLSTHDLDLALRTADRIWLLPAGGPLQVGAPEDLVLSGAFEQAFRSAGIQFDQETGSFRASMPANDTIRLVGEGTSAIWTQRALERAGFRVTQNGTPAAIQVEVSGMNGSTRWRSMMKGTAATHQSVYDLVNHLQEMHS